MKVYLDEDVSPVIATILRDDGVDAVSAHEVGNVQFGDRAQLMWATGEERAIVTANIKDFVRLAHEAIATNTAHAGIILIPSSFAGDEFRAIADGIDEVLKEYSHDLCGSVVYIRRPLTR